MKMTVFGKFALMLIAMFVFIISVSSASAEDFVIIRPVEPSSADYAVTSPAGQVALKIKAGANAVPLTMKMMMIVEGDKINHFFTLPEKTEPASDLYFVKFTPYSESIFSNQPTITFKYSSDSKPKQLYYYDWMDLKFKKAVYQSSSGGTVTFELPVKKSVMFALFNEQEIGGLASWYVHPKYPSDLVAASRDFAINSKIKVINPTNNKEVVVTVKDYGPKNCSQWTAEEIAKMGPCRERILDLSKIAFQALASTALGVIKVIVRPLL